MRNRSISICAGILLSGAFFVFAGNVLLVRAQTAPCSGASIAAGTCNWNGGGLITLPPGINPGINPKGDPYVFARLEFANGDIDVFSTNPHITTTAGEHDWWYVAPGGWFSVHPPGSRTIRFIAYYAGDKFRYPNGVEVTVPAGGISYNCMDGLMNSSGCPVAVFTSGYSLSVSKSGQGIGNVAGEGINCGTTCSGIFGMKYPVNLTATPDGDSVFTSWGGACSGTSPTCTVTITGNTSVTASFDRTASTNILVTKSGSGTGTVSGNGIDCGNTCSASVGNNSAVTLVASSDTGSTFAGWSGACSGTSPTCSITVNGDTSVTASFNKAQVDTTAPVLSTTSGLSPSGDVIANLSWSGGTGDKTSYQIDRGLDSSSLMYTLATVSGTTKSYSDNLLTSSGTFDILRRGPVTESYRVRGKYADGMYTDYSNIVKIKNCIKLAGNGIYQGEGAYQIVFIAGGLVAEDINMKGYFSRVSDIIDNGLSKVEPFKSRMDKFSFYVDLQPYDEEGLGIAYSNTDYKEYDRLTESEIVTSSSCGDSGHIYVFLSGNPLIYPAYTAYNIGKDLANFVLLDIPSLRTGGYNLAMTAMHELGHAVGDLSDEYPNPAQEQQFSENKLLENCSLEPYLDFRSSIDNRMYGSYESVSTDGCWEGINYEHSPYYRPSPKSIMYDQATELRFNVISCGYIISGLNFESIYQDNAEKHWPECLKMAQNPGSITSAGIPPAAPKPTLTFVSASTVAPGSTLAISAVSHTVPDKKPFPTDGTVFEKIGYFLDGVAKSLVAAVAGTPSAVTGSGFTPTDNAVQISNSATTTEILGLNSDGTTISFTIPANLPAGSYSLKVGAFNSDWSNSVPLTITAAPIPLSTTNLSCTMTLAPAKPCRTACPITSPASSGVYSNATFKFAGSVSGAQSPYTYVLGNIVNTSNAAITSRATVPGTASARVSSKKLPYLEVTSKDGNTAKIQCYPIESGVSARPAPTNITRPTAPVTTRPVTNPTSTALNVTNASCNASDAVSVSGFHVFVAADGSVSGGAAPYSYELKRNSSLDGIIVSGATSSSLPFQKMWTVTIPNNSSGWYLQVSSTDGKTATVNCIALN